jgi:hypothetical protein
VKRAFRKAMASCPTPSLNSFAAGVATFVFTARPPFFAA